MVLFITVFIDMVVLAFIWGPTMLSSTAMLSAENVDWYHNKRKGIGYGRGSLHFPHSLFFAAAWIVLYACISVALLLYIPYLTILDPLVPATYNQVVLICMVFINLWFNHMWSPIFFAMRSPLLALIDTFIVAGTAITACIYFGKEGVDTDVNVWWSFGLYGLYALWTIAALGMNLAWVIMTRSDPDMSKMHILGRLAELESMKNK